MKRFTKVAALGLAALLSFSGLVACNNKTNSSDPSKDQGAQKVNDSKVDDSKVDDSKDETKESNDESQSEEVSKPQDDSEDQQPTELYKMKILASDGTTGKFKFADREKYKIWPEFHNLLKAKGLDPEFEVVASDQYLTTIQTRMQTGTDMPEFARFSDLSDTEIFKMADRGLILPLNDMIEQHSDGTAKAFFEGEGKGARSWMLNTRDDDQVFFISQIQETTYEGKPGSTNIVMTIRQDWLEAAGLDTPTTAAEFKDALKAFQEKDVNGSGVADEVLSLDASGFGGHISEWFGLVYGMTNFIIEDGQPSDFTSPWLQEGIKPYFEYMKSLHDDKLLDPSVIGATSENQNIPNNVAAAVNNYTMATWNEPAVVGAEDPRYLPLGAIKGTDGIDPLMPIEPPAMSFGRWGFTKEATNMEANAALLDVLCSEEYINLTQWGLEGDTHEVDADGNRKLLPIALHNAYDEAYDKGIVVGDFLWANGHTFPKRRFVPMELEISQVPEYKAEAQKEFIKYGKTTPMGISNYLPVATIEQSERLSFLSTDLNTRAAEIATGLITGNMEIDQLDSLVEELKSLGLTESLEIQQELLERAKELGIFG